MRSERDHICRVKRAAPVDGRPSDGWLMECSCGFSAGNFIEYEHAFDEGHAHLDTIAADEAVRRCLVIEERPAGIRVREPDRAPVSVLACRAGEAPTIETIDNTLSAAQHLVGGYITVWPLLRDERGELVLYCDEDGEPLGLPLNRVVHNGRGEARPIVGSFFFARTVGGAMTSLSAEDVITCRGLLASQPSHTLH